MMFRALCTIGIFLQVVYGLTEDGAGESLLHFKTREEMVFPIHAAEEIIHASTRCLATTNVALGANCTMNRPDPYWNPGSKDCNKLVDGVALFGNGQGSHIYDDSNESSKAPGFAEIRFEAPKLITEITIKRWSEERVGNFKIQILKRGHRWKTVYQAAAHTLYSDITFPLPGIKKTRGVRFVGSTATDEPFRLAEIEVQGCGIEMHGQPTCDAVSNIALASKGSTCEQNTPDPFWGHGSTNCRRMIDGVPTWDSEHGLAIFDDDNKTAGIGYATVTFPTPSIITGVIVRRWEQERIGHFELQAFDEFTEAWITLFEQPHHTFQSDFAFSLPETLTTTAVRFIGTFGEASEPYRISEIEVQGCEAPAPPTPFPTPSTTQPKKTGTTTTTSRAYQCRSTYNIALETEGSECETNIPDPHWNRYNTSCEKLIDGLAQFGDHKGVHIYDDNKKTKGRGFANITFPGPRLVTGITVKRWKQERIGHFELNVLTHKDHKKHVPEWITVYKESLQTTLNSDLPFMLGMPIQATMVSFLGHFGTGEPYRLAEIEVQGCEVPRGFMCKARENIALASTGTRCKMSAKDKFWKRKSYDCYQLIDGVATWQHGHGLHIFGTNKGSKGAGSATLEFAGPRIVRSITIKRWQQENIGHFRLETYNVDKHVWDVQYEQIPDTLESDFSFTLPASVLTTAVRFLGTFGNSHEPYRLTEIEVSGCDPNPDAYTTTTTTPKPLPSSCTSERSNIALASAGATCKQNYPDDTADNPTKSKDCTALIDGIADWSAGNGRRIFDDFGGTAGVGFAEIRFPGRRLVTEITLKRDPDERIGRFALQTLDMFSESSWTTQYHQTNETVTSDLSYEFSREVETMGVRFIGAFGTRQPYHITEIEVKGCER